MTDLSHLLPISSSGVPALDTPAAEAASAAKPLSALAADFESLFLSMLLKEMRQTGGEDGLFSQDASDTYGGIFDLYMSQHLANAGGLGLAQYLQNQLTMQAQS